MKAFKNILSIAFLVGLITSCQSVEYPEGYNQQTDGLLNFYVKLPGGAAEYSSKVSGPFNEGDTVYINIPSMDEDPVDLTDVQVRANIDFNCYVVPSLIPRMDLSKPFDITVRDALGNMHHNVIKVVLMRPKVSGKPLWTKTSKDLFNDPNISGIAVNDKYVGLLCGGNPSKVMFLNKETGEVIKKKDAPISFMMGMATDDNNHILANRYNIYGAGFMVYLYDDNLNSTLILNYASDGQVTNPDYNGMKMDVCGDITKGKAFIYCTAPSDQRVFYWEFMDGICITPQNKPNIIRYGWAGANWKYAPIQRASIADDSETYIAFCNYQANDNIALKYGSRFHAFSKNAETIRELDRSNYAYKIMDFRVMDIMSHKYLFLFTEGYQSWDGKEISLYDITDPKSFEMTPKSENYTEEFQLWKSGAYGGTNYSGWGGSIAVYNEGNQIYVYGVVNDWDTAGPKVVAHKLKINR